MCPDSPQEPKSRRAEHDDDGLEANLLWEYLDRLNAGEALDLDEIERKHPDVASELIKQLEAFSEFGSKGAEAKPEPLGALGDYTLRRQIGRGGMGVVYEAWQSTLERQVALKVLPAGIAADDKAFLRFMREAKTAAKLNHQNVVSVYGMGVEQNTPYYSMEYVEGESLAQILVRLKEAEPEAETPFGKKDGVRYFHNLAETFADVADGLQHAHSKGVIHRDIKPSNLILDGEDQLRILDFGLARLEGQESLTFSGDVVGTPLYMSPEQARRRKIQVDRRTDIYSLGATMYEAICGRPPFRGKDHADTLSQIIEREPVDPRKLNLRVPKELETIVLKCLRKEADERYGTAEALAQDLRRFVRGDPVEARPESRWERLSRRVRRQRVKLAVAAAGLVLVLACGALVREVLLEKEKVRTYEMRDYEHTVVVEAMEGDASLPVRLARAGRLDEAAQAARVAAEHRPGDAERWIALGRMLVHVLWERRVLGEEPRGESTAPEIGELLEVSRRAVDLDPQNPAAYTLLSKALEASGDLTGADEAIRRARELDARAAGAHRSGRGTAGAAVVPLVAGARTPKGYFEVEGRLEGCVRSTFTELHVGASRDGRRLFFASFRPGGTGDVDLYMAVWDEDAGAFTGCRELSELNSPRWDGGASLSADGRTLFFHSTRRAPPAKFANDFFQATWDPDLSAFTDVRALEGINTGFNDMGHPCISRDGLELFFHSTNRPGGTGGRDLWVAWRDSVNEEFTADKVKPLEEINSQGDDFMPWISGDGTTLFWTGFPGTDSHAGDSGWSSIWMATRPAPRDPATGEPLPFAGVQRVPLVPKVGAISVTVSDAWPEPGAKVYFISALPGDRALEGDGDVYVARWRPEEPSSRPGDGKDGG